MVKIIKSKGLTKRGGRSEKERNTERGKWSVRKQKKGEKNAWSQSLCAYRGERSAGRMVVVGGGPSHNPNTSLLLWYLSSISSSRAVGYDV